MACIYFPGCKYTAHSPEKSKQLSEYLEKKMGIGTTGCCSIHYKDLTEEDTAIYICPTCRAILQESAPQAKLMSVYELLMEDGDFPWPDYKGTKITVQDCWRIYDERPMQDAVREVLKRMNFSVFEIEDSFEKADFCGISLLRPYSERYEYLARKRFIEDAGNKFVSYPPEEQKRIMEQHCAQYKTEFVTCYCTGCLEGLELGEAKGIHLMDLIMEPDAAIEKLL